MTEYTFYKTENSNCFHTRKYCLKGRGDREGQIEEIGVTDIDGLSPCTSCMRQGEVDKYTFLAQLFNEVTGIADLDRTRGEKWENRFDIIEEEVEELREEVGEFVESVDESDMYDGKDKNEAEKYIVEELADVIITCFTCAEALDVDIAGAYERKMGYNMHKSGDRMEDGKVQDDSDVPKPDFGDCLWDGDS